MPLGKIEVGLNGFVLGNDQDCLSGCYDSNQQFSGRLDDLRVYNRVVNAQEVTALFNLTDGEVSNSERGSSKVLGTCESSLTIEIERNFDTFSWNNGSQNRSIVVNSSGEYKDTVNVNFNTLPQMLVSIPSTNLTCDEEIELQATDGFDEYRWQDGSTGISYRVTEPGVYLVTGKTVCGESVSNEIEITREETNPLEIRSNSLEVGCQQTLTLSATYGYTNYMWSTGDNAQTIEINSSGEYTIEAINECGDRKEYTIKIEPRIADVSSLPNAFTPNGDGVNEVFEVNASFLGSKNITLEKPLVYLLRQYSNAV